MIIAGCGLNTIKVANGSKAVLQEYTMNLTRLVAPIDRLRKMHTKVLWALQQPVNEDKLGPDFKPVTNDQIDRYNKEALDVLLYSDVYMWRSARLVAEGMISESPDGVSLASKPLQHSVQILLNMYCNDYMNFNDGTCCSSAESCTTLQIVTFIILIVW